MNVEPGTNYFRAHVSSEGTRGRVWVGGEACEDEKQAHLFIDGFEFCQFGSVSFCLLAE